MEAIKKLCVVIPVHRPQMPADEVASLQACKAQLSQHDCYLLYPEGMDVSAYVSIFDGLLLKPVPPGWLSSIENYNKTKVSLGFYQLFGNYQYMLTYELDAYIFEPLTEDNEAFRFDFIGAPFQEGYWKAAPEAPFIKGCNSGFSIRNIRSCIAVLNSMKKYRFHWLIYKIFLSWSLRLRDNLDRLTNKKYEVFIWGQVGFAFSGEHINEDLVWSRVVPALFQSFTVADPYSSLRFSFEYNPAHLLELNKGKLPLGCHAWYKHYEFWRKYIDVR